MKNLIKILLAAFIMVFSIMPSMAFQFPDVAKDHWAASQIDELSDKGVIVGYPDGTFKPDENVTRAEFASMAIRALGQEHASVAQPVNFTDIDSEYWAYDSIQKALYFDLISCPENGGLFRPDDTVTREESMTVAVNALTTEQISLEKAREVLAKYADANTLPEAFLIPAGKSEILNMIVVMPSDSKKANLEPLRPATRAEVSAILYNMMEQAKLNPNAKLAEAMRKKTGEGFVVENATVQGSIGIIPEGTVVPVQLTKYISSQSSQAGDLYVAVAPQNYVTKDKFILVYKGSTLKGQLIDVRSGKWFVRNGVLILDNSLITTSNDQTAVFQGVGDIKKHRNLFMKIVRAVLKGEKLEVTPENTVNLKLLKPVKIDLTNGWIYE
ncbi:TPA: S-layer homology domain-containing protein [Candidatus Scatousia excrementigallinarum]|uniref:S-layer homology domain-containing protein n=1 Tax=Candidatus Scatousia excrementigallinarum TaxID=2840935 RepID=A0A9D1JPJ4_9BACT|nr:S-layer homology domain-containing protein [Candidatus Scatousia excrementigallinarum]